MVTSRQPILLGWHLAENFGWGILALNVFRQWALSPDIAPVMAMPISPASFAGLKAMETPAIDAALAFSNQIAGQIAQMGNVLIEARIPVIHALGNGFRVVFQISGTRNIGRAIFENTSVAPEALARYDALLCASEWNAGLLKAHLDKPVHVIPEAIDHALFCPGPKAGLLPAGKFYVFTGGKIEFRKGQDLVLRAFREFARRHDDAVLVTAWHSPWPQISLGFQGTLDAPLKSTPTGTLDIAGWVAANGIDPARVVDLGPMPNHLVPGYLREMDCALQPSRAEAATNMVVMEEMACGVPVITAKNTGMLDLIRADNCIALERQGPVSHPDGWGTSGWGESDVGEILDALERLYASADLRARVGRAASAFMQTRSWADHAEKLKDLALGRG